MARLMWVFAVSGLITMRSAIWSLDRPCATRATASRSRRAVSAGGPIYDEFVDRVVSTVRALRLGVDCPDVGAEFEAMTCTAQVDPGHAHITHK